MRNKLTMALWGALIAFLVLIGFATLLVGFVILMPLIGHATWHAYRSGIDASAWPATKSGAVLGGIIGGVTMASMVAIGGSQCDERNEIVCTSGPAWTIGGGAVGAVLGALAGATIGSRMRTRETVYPEPRRKRPALSMAPLVTFNSASIAGSVRW